MKGRAKGNSSALTQGVITKCIQGRERFLNDQVRTMREGKDRGNAGNEIGLRDPARDFCQRESPSGTIASSPVGCTCRIRRLKTYPQFFARILQVFEYKMPSLPQAGLAPRQHDSRQCLVVWQCFLFVRTTPCLRTGKSQNRFAAGD